MADAKTDILALDRQRLDAMIAADTAALDRLLHRDLKYTHSSGTVDSKESYIRGVREKLWDYRSIKTSGETVAVYGDTALVHCRLQIDVQVSGADRQVDSRALTVWVKDDGRWQAVAVHSTPYPKG
jgi:ketosteroid isomerase-like protein